MAMSMQMFPPVASPPLPFSLKADPVPACARCYGARGTSHKSGTVESSLCWLVSVVLKV